MREMRRIQELLEEFERAHSHNEIVALIERYGLSPDERSQVFMSLANRALATLPLSEHRDFVRRVAEGAKAHTKCPLTCEKLDAILRGQRVNH